MRVQVNCSHSMRLIDAIIFVIHSCCVDSSTEIGFKVEAGFHPVPALGGQVSEKYYRL